jgi:hypothetical protein
LCKLHGFITDYFNRIKHKTTVSGYKDISVLCRSALLRHLSILLQLQRLWVMNNILGWTWQRSWPILKYHTNINLEIFRNITETLAKIQFPADTGEF